MATQSKKDQTKTRGKIARLVELTRHERPETIGRPLVDTLRAPAKELRATNQIRLVSRGNTTST